MLIKEFKTLDEQIELLKKRGLIIRDEERAKKYLLSQNYYNIINGYAKFFTAEGDKYISGTTFEEITSLYVFERELKQALFLTMLEAEAHLRSIFSYRFAEKYKDDPYAYLNLSNYKNDNIDGMLSVIQTISKISRTIDCYKRRQEEGSIIHYLKKYKYVPIWVLINYLSFGELRTLLEKSPEDIQNNVARDCMDFVSQNIQGELEVFHPGTLCSFVANINEIRNICAHNNRIIGFKCHHDDKYWKPLHSKYHIVTTDLRRSAYSVFISLQCFVSQTEYGILHNTILKRTKTLSRNLRAISVNEILLKLGFPEDWHLKEQRLSQ